MDYTENEIAMMIWYGELVPTGHGTLTNLLTEDDLKETKEESND